MNFATWLAERVDSGELTETTYEEYEQRVKRFETFRDGDGPPASDTVIQFLQSRVDDGVARGTLELDKAALRWFAKFHGQDPEFPTVEEWLESEGPDSTVERDCFSDEELFRLVETAADRTVRDGAIFGLLADTGIRVGELVALDVGDLAVNVNGQWRAEADTLADSGADVGNTATITPATRYRITEYLSKWGDFRRRSESSPVKTPNADDPLFVGDRGRLSTEAVRYLCSQVGDTVDHPDLDRSRVSPQTFRHTVGYQARRRGLTQREIGDLLGKNTHASEYTDVPPRLQLTETDTDPDADNTRPEGRV